MIRKFFPQDKNYLLEEAQLRLQDCLLTMLIDRAIETYRRDHNPLGLNDAFSEKIAKYYPQDLSGLNSFYQNIAGVYRYKFGEIQLGFLWDGKDHTDKYAEDWSKTFHAWTDQLCRRTQFAQAVLDLTVFMPDNDLVHLAESRMNAVMLELFELRIHKQRGIVEMKVV